MKISRRATAVALAATLVTPAVALATNGMFMIGHGAKATAMGGAGVAYPQDAMAVAYNPASMTGVEETRFDATLELLRPPRSVFHDSSLIPADVRSENDLFPIPAVGAVVSDAAMSMAWGVAVIGAGLGTNYPQRDGTMFDPNLSVNPHRKVGVFLMQMQILPSFAYRITENHSVGATFVMAAQTFKAFGLEAFGDLGFTTNTEGLTDQGYDWGFGAGYRLGWFGQFFDKRLNLGINYAPKVQMQKFNRYDGLFANHGDFDIPESYTFGIAYKFSPKLAVAFDIQRILWSEVPSIGNPGPNAADPTDFNPLCPGIDPPECQLGGSKGMGFGWTNQTVYKLGAEYKFTPGLIFRAGLNYGKAPIPEDQVLFNFLAPATTEKHITLGATLGLSKASDLTLTLMHAFENTIKGPTAFGPQGSGVVVDGSNAAISMSQTSIGIAYGSRF